MEVCFLASGEMLTVLAAQVGVSSFCQRLFQNGSREIKDDEVFDAAAVKVSLVKLDYFPSDPEQTQQMVAACRENDLVVLEALLQRPCNPNVVDKEGWTPLHHAVEHAHLEASQLLLEAGANKDAQEEDGMTPLFFAAAAGHANVVALLLEAGANKDQPQHGMATPLYIAAQNGHLDSVRLLVESRAAVNQADDHSETPLMTTASEGYLEIVKFLVASGARCDMTRDDGFTAMDCATQMSNVEVVRFLAKPTVEHMAEAESGGKEVFGVWGQGSESAAASRAKSWYLWLSCLRPMTYWNVVFSFVPLGLDMVGYKNKIRQTQWCQHQDLEFQINIRFAYIQNMNEL